MDPAPKPRILAVDDRRNMLRLLTKVIGDAAEVVTAAGGVQALEILRVQAIDVVLCDLRMPDMDGLEVLRACRSLQPRAAFILMTAYASVETAASALSLGAFDYLSKPFEPEHARALLLRALDHVAGGAEVEEAEGAEAPVEVLPGVIGRSAALRELGDLVRRIADSDTTALILGETGTGKERIARAIHALSPRAAGPLIAINCAAVPGELLESELFGHAQGAFTGAHRPRLGLFEAAAGGSLFLDELGELPLVLQAKLTRALEERAIRRVGEVHERPVDVRLIAATHRDLGAMVTAGSFREDLWYRLNVAALRIPPLRARRADVAPLAAHFLRSQIARTPRSPAVVGFSRPALDALIAFAWPGNVRQLRSAVERACVVARGVRIDLGDLPPELLWGAEAAELTAEVSAPRPQDPLAEEALAGGTWAETLQRARDEVGRRYLRALLRRFGGQVAAAAIHAGVERESFYRLLRRHGVDPAEFREE